jgi:hypothetical protein
MEDYRWLFWVIMALGAVLLGLSVYRYRNGQLYGALLRVYSATLVIMSLLEMAYLFLAGPEKVYWFLSFDKPFRSVLYIIPLMIFAWVQLSAVMNAIDDMVLERKPKKTKWLWVFAAGPVLGIIIAEIVAPYISTGGGEPLLKFYQGVPLAVFVGQIPIGFIVARKRSNYYPSGKWAFLLCYPIISTAVVVLIVGSMYLFIIVVALFIVGQAKGVPETEAEYQDRRRREEHGKVYDKMISGQISPAEAWYQHQDVDMKRHF